jgi:hypothetical protein
LNRDFAAFAVSDADGFVDAFDKDLSVAVWPAQAAPRMVIPSMPALIGAALTASSLAGGITVKWPELVCFNGCAPVRGIVDLWRLQQSGIVTFSELLRAARGIAPSYRK